MPDLLDVSGDVAEAETSEAGSRVAGLVHEVVMEAEMAEERGKVADEEEGVSLEAVDDA